MKLTTPALFTLAMAFNSLGLADSTPVQVPTKFLAEIQSPATDNTPYEVVGTDLDKNFTFPVGPDLFNCKSGEVKNKACLFATSSLDTFKQPHKGTPIPVINQTNFTIYGYITLTSTPYPNRTVTSQFQATLPPVCTSNKQSFSGNVKNVLIKIKCDATHSH